VFAFGSQLGCLFSGGAVQIPDREGVISNDGGTRMQAEHTGMEKAFQKDMVVCWGCNSFTTVYE
jgi:hypothetical protein